MPARLGHPERQALAKRPQPARETAMKRLVLVLLTSLMAAPFPALAQSRELGTLFFTPAERSQLDKLRRGENISTGESADPVINGYIRRSDGVNLSLIHISEPTRL